MKSLLKDAKRVLEDWKRMPNYPVQERLLECLVDYYPDHNSREGVDYKVKYLNKFYSTYIMATNSVVNHIYQKRKQIDKGLQDGDPKAVGIIAKCNDVGRTNYSFATKYCALHQPNLYPIYDSIVSDVFRSLREKGLLQDYIHCNKEDFDSILQDYTQYKELYNSFMKQYGLTSLSYREVDWYLWSAYKISDHTYEIEVLAPIKRKVVKVELTKK